MLQYCIAEFSQYHFKGSMTKKKKKKTTVMAAEDLKSERTQRSPKTGTMI